MLSFITGSRAYGKPRPDSDIDLVVFISPQDANKLAAIEPQPNKDIVDYYGKTKTMNLRFGKLNLLACTDKSRFLEWHKGTRLLKAQAPVERDAAIEMFEKIFEKRMSCLEECYEIGMIAQEMKDMSNETKHPYENR